MPFSYYSKLNKTQKAIYRASDRAKVVSVPDRRPLQPYLMDLKVELVHGNPLAVTGAVRGLLNELVAQFEVPPVKVRVLAARPHDDYGELHGMYERPLSGRAWPSIFLWMRTAKKQQVVAFKTFLRTVLHEFGHHLDYELLGLADSFHTEGFYQRENALFRQVMGYPASK
ncbi:MAG: hypothetical protein AAF438_05255 [Pseudomonadota bacterium]